jgi:hypothetical protein
MKENKEKAQKIQKEAAEDRINLLTQLKLKNKDSAIALHYYDVLATGNEYDGQVISIDKITVSEMYMSYNQKLKEVTTETFDAKNKVMLSSELKLHHYYYIIPVKDSLMLENYSFIME